MKHVEHEDQALAPEIQSMVEKAKVESLPEDDLNDIESNLVTAIRQQGHLLQVSEENTAKSFLAKLAEFFSLPRLAAGATAGLAMVITSLVFVTSTTPTAFAQMVQQMNTMQSMSYTGNIISHGMPLMDLKVLYKAPNKVRVETTPANQPDEQGKTLNILDLSKGKGLILFPAAKLATPFSFDPGNYSESFQSNPLSWWDSLQNYQGEVVELDVIQIDGRYARGFVIEEQGIVITTWADIDTNIPLRFSMTTDGPDQKPVIEMKADLQFNLPMDDALFSLTLPEGFQTQAEDQ